MMVNFGNYILLDAARMEGAVEKAKTTNSDFDSLYRGRSEEELADVAPYLFTFPGTDEFSSWILENGWDNAWGIFIDAPLTLEELRKHFRKFLLIKTEDSRELYFRFYDPRVFRIFLPTCDTQQLKEFFGPVQQFICEDDNAMYALQFSFDGKQLITERVTANSIFPTIDKPDKASFASLLRETNKSFKQGNIEQQQIKPKRKFF